MEHQEALEIPADVVGVIFSHARFDVWDLPRAPGVALRLIVLSLASYHCVPSSVALVCKTWAKMAFLVEELSLLPFPRARDPGRYRNLFASLHMQSRFTRLKSLKVIKGAYMSEQSARALGKLPLLESVEFFDVGEQLGNSVVISLLRACTQLKRFGLTRCSAVGPFVIPELCNLTRLESLTLDDNLFLREDLDFKIMPKLAESHLSSTLTDLKIGLVAVYTMSEDWIALSKMTKLKTLFIRAHCGSLDKVPIEFCDLSSLQSLTVEYSDYFQLPENGMSKLVNLTTYSIKPHQYRDDEYSCAGFPVLNTEFDVPPRLKKITLERCTFRYPRAVSLLSGSLEELALSPTPEISPETLRAICRLPKLRRLKMTFPSYWTAQTCEEFREILGSILVEI